MRWTVLLYLAVLAVARSALAEPELVDRDLSETTASSSSYDKVKVELYYMPQCPGCRQLITTTFSEAFRTPGFTDMADVTFIPYGTAFQKTNDQQQRVFDNVLESCALHTIGKKHQDQQFEYIECVDHFSRAETDPARVDRLCAVSIGLSSHQTRDIETCAISREGHALALRNVQQSESIGLGYFPWIVVERQNSAAIEAAIWESLFDYVCSIYSGPNKSPACPENTNNTLPSGDDSIAEQL